MSVYQEIPRQGRVSSRLHRAPPQAQYYGTPPTAIHYPLQQPGPVFALNVQRPSTDASERSQSAPSLADSRTIKAVERPLMSHTAQTQPVPAVFDEDNAAPPSEPLVQRSMSRYHRGYKQKATGPSRGDVREVSDARERPQQVLRDRQKVKMVVMERATTSAQRESQRPDMQRERASRPTYRGQEPADPPRAPIDGQRYAIQGVHPQYRAAPADIDAPPDIPSAGAVGLHSSQSRYRRVRSQAHPHQPDQSAYGNVKASTSFSAKTQHDHREAIRRLQRQSSFPTLPHSSGPRLLTKASLDQLPDDTMTESMAIKRRISEVRQQSVERHRLEKRQEEAQNEVKQMLDAETERQRKMQERIRNEKEKADKAKAEERARMAEKKREAEDKSAREALLQQKLEEAEAALAQARREADARVEAEKAAARNAKAEPSRPDMPGRESSEHRLQRHRKRSLSKLEGGPPIVRDDALPPPPPLPTQEPTPDARSHFALFRKRRPTDASKGETVARGKSTKKASEKDAPYIKQGGGDMPGIDAPISAVNAGERRVLIECNKSSMYLPVTPTTTPVDLIRSAATCLTEPITVNSSVLLESFGKVGVQRPLRKYEHIRDVINSWDDDRQNSLIVVPSATGGNDHDLEAASAPKTQPGDFSCQLHYSQKPGKWEKRWVALRSDGQVTWSKNENHKDSTNICHMTDFDIYSPEAHQISKKIKPPKKICFAIKSQQKSNMFMSLDSFVHFFCTNDKQVATEWYTAVQSWRSWYLVNVMGEGKEPETKRAQLQSPGGPLSLPGLADPSNRDSHYQLGSFKPLLDLDAFGAPRSNPEDPSVRGLAQHARNKSSRTNDQEPTASFPAWLTSNPSAIIDTRNRNGISSSQSTTEDPAFAPTGLLGRSYSTRIKAQQDRETNHTEPSNPFTGGLLNDPSPKTTATLAGFNTVSPTDHPRPTTSGLTRKDTSRRADRGFTPDTTSAAPLIDSAKSPTDDSPTKNNGMANSRSRSTHKHGITTASPESGDRHAMPFAADGLIASSREGRGMEARGRGVMDGSKATGPMLDVSQPSEYAEGSLLRKMEMERPDVPVVWRGKGKEVVVATGERGWGRG